MCVCVCARDFPFSVIVNNPSLSGNNFKCLFYAVCDELFEDPVDVCLAHAVFS